MISEFAFVHSHLDIYTTSVQSAPHKSKLYKRYNMDAINKVKALCVKTNISTRAQRIDKHHKHIVEMLEEHRAFSTGVSRIIAEYSLNAFDEAFAAIIDHIVNGLGYLLGGGDIRAVLIMSRQCCIAPMFYKCGGGKATTTDSQFFRNMGSMVRGQSGGDNLTQKLRSIMEKFMGLTKAKKKDTRRRMRMFVELELGDEDQRMFDKWQTQRDKEIKQQTNKMEMEEQANERRMEDFQRRFYNKMG